MNKLKLVLLLVLCVSLMGCGYTVSSRLGNPSTEYVCLEMFENFTRPYQPGLEIRLNRTLLDTFMTSGYKISSKATNADVTVRGRILDHKQTVLSTSPDQNPTEISVIIKVRVKFEDKFGQTQIYDFKNDRENFAIALGEQLSDAETRALAEISRKIMHQLSGIEVPIE